MNTETRVVPDKLFSPSLFFSPSSPIGRRHRNQKKTNRRKDFQESTLGAVDLTSFDFKLM